jgi:hypothetical protein
LSRHAKPILQRHILFEGRRIFLVRRHKQISTLTIVHILTDFLFEAFDHRQAFLRQFHIDLGRELITHTARASACRAGAEIFLLFNQDNILHAALRQMIGCAGSHDAPADNNNICCSW